MNDKTADIKRKCKEVSGSHTIIKKEMPKNIGKPLILLAQQMICRWEYKDSSNVQKIFGFYIQINIQIIIRYHAFMCTSKLMCVCKKKSRIF